jgi:N-acetylmuramic acid 6-phosphate etherase
VRAQAARIAEAAELLALRYGADGRIVFAGAGTSGRIAHAEAAELPGTFGLDRRRVLGRVAGGVASTDADEDDLEAAARDIAEVDFTSADVLVAVTASGSTPYTLAYADAAKAAGTALIAVTATVDSPLASRADVSIEADVGPEVLRGSSRLTAATAQKLALDAMTTAAMALLGHVHGDVMIDVVGANAKLHARIVDLVADIAGAGWGAAAQALAACDGDTRAAVLVLTRDLEPADARTLAAAHRTLRAAMLNGM